MTRIKRTLTLMSLCLLLLLSACGGNRGTSVVNYDDAPVSAAPLDWVNGRIAKGRRKASVITSSFNIHDDYHQYYLLELADGTFSLMQIPQNDVFALERGNKVLLPIGRKANVLSTARKYLSEICEKNGGLNGRCVLRLRQQMV